MKEEILDLLKQNSEGYVSGGRICEDFGVSRTAIWKYITKLKEEGYEIESVPKHGYKLIASPDLLTYAEVKEYLTTKKIGRCIMHYDSIDSTNEKAKNIALGAEHGTVVISEEQTSGKGRLGRSFVSPKGEGIWMSVILKPDIEPMKVSIITQIGAAAVNKALSSINIDSAIKWPNDIVLNGKKVCGILTEMSCELTMVNFVVLGIGINVNLDEKSFGEEVINTATSLKIEMNEKVNRQKLAAKVLNYFEELYEAYVLKDDITGTIKICKEKSALIGKDIRVIRRGVNYPAKALDLDKDGSLIVEYENGETERLISGEVSIRGKKNYV